MYTTVLVSLLLAAVGINAAPTLSPRLPAIAVSIYDSAGCNNGPAATTAYVSTDGSCQGISPILTAQTSSALIDTATASLPAGCTVTLYTDNTCSSVNSIPVTRAGQCFTFGTGKFIHSARTSGTC